jgi:hypothetical protein
VKPSVNQFSFRSKESEIMRMRSSAAALAAGVVATSLLAADSSAAIPFPYTVQLQARASVGTGATTFNLPAGSSFSSATPDINNNRQIAFKLTTSGTSGSQGIWRGQANAASTFGSGGVLTNATDANASLSDPTINIGGDVAWPQTSGSTGNGIWKYAAATNVSNLFSNGPVGASSWASVRINNAAQIGARPSFSGANAYVSYDTNATTAMHAAEVGADSTSPYSFLFSPNFDDNRNIYGVVRVGPAGTSGDATRPDQLRRFASNGTSSIIVEDHDSNASSPYFQFDATAPGVSDDGNWVAFIARTTTASSTRTIFLTNATGTVTKTIAAPGAGLTSIDNFAPAVNDAGVVTFRATDLNGKISVFVGDGTSLQRIIGVGDTVHTDIGDFAINSLGGNPTINDLGDVAFGGGLGTGGNFIAAALVPEPGMGALVCGVVAGWMVRRRKR